jgi:hypothetical protein
MQGLELSHVGPFSSQEFETYFDESLYDAFRVQLITEISSSATTVVMGKGSVPVGSNDEFFPGLTCAACRAVVQSSANLTGTWTIVVRGGSRAEPSAEREQEESARAKEIARSREIQRTWRR